MAVLEREGCSSNTGTVHECGRCPGPLAASVQAASSSHSSSVRVMRKQRNTVTVPKTVTAVITVTSVSFVCQQCWVGLKSFQNTACIRYVGLRGQCQLTRPSRPNAVLAVGTVEAAEAVLPVGMSGCQPANTDASTPVRCRSAICGSAVQRITRHAFPASCRESMRFLQLLRAHTTVALKPAFAATPCLGLPFCESTTSLRSVFVCWLYNPPAIMLPT